MSTVVDLHEACNAMDAKLTVTFRDVEGLATVIAREDGATWGALGWEERDRYFRLAKAAVLGLGIELDNGRGL